VVALASSLAPADPELLSALAGSAAELLLLSSGAAVEVLPELASSVALWATCCQRSQSRSRPQEDNDRATTRLARCIMG
jgi:hypothetical protein